MGKWPCSPVYGHWGYKQLRQMTLFGPASLCLPLGSLYLYIFLSAIYRISICPVIPSQIDAPRLNRADIFCFSYIFRLYSLVRIPICKLRKACTLPSFLSLVFTRFLSLAGVSQRGSEGVDISFPPLYCNPDKT